MTAQFPLLDWAHARRTDPPTSRAAANSVNVTDMEARVVGALKAHGPLTTYEIADILRLSLVTVSPRLRPLADKLIVEDSGTRKMGESGRKQIVWQMRKSK